jgi:hypothetical protein
MNACSFGYETNRLVLPQNFGVVTRQLPSSRKGFFGGNNTHTYILAADGSRISIFGFALAADADLLFTPLHHRDGMCLFVCVDSVWTVDSGTLWSHPPVIPQPFHCSYGFSTKILFISSSFFVSL